MNLTQSIESAFSNYFNFNSRSSRSEFWFFELFLIISGIAVGLAETIITATLGFPLFLQAIWGLFTFIPSISIAVRRLHDIDKSGWWLLLHIIILFGSIVLLIFHIKNTQGPNKYGEGPLKPIENT